MQHLKKYLLVLLLITCLLPHINGQQVYPDPGYQLLNDKAFIQNRNFYLFTLLEKLPAVNRLLVKDTVMQSLAAVYRQRLHAPGSTQVLQPFLFDEAIITRVGSYWPNLLKQYPVEMGELLKHMRSSGFFQLYAGEPDHLLLSHAWQDAARGISYIINAYTSNKGFRYPKIDSARFNVQLPVYKKALLQLKKTAAAKDNPATLFFQPSLQLAIGLLLLNKHDECARYEPLEAANAGAYTQLKKTDWEKYTYSALLIPGAGPGNHDPISETGKNRCRLGADLYRKGVAPCIIVSGGHVHPFGTPYAEAVEMKKYMVNELKVPASAVIIEPYARHTTTNVRNAVRIAWKSGMPLQKRMLCVSDAMQLYYIASSVFEQRCKEELGYMPATDRKQADLYTLSFLPDLQSLQANALDPLDP